MTQGAITSSILRAKAARRNLPKIAKAPYDVQFAVYRETLVDLERYLDVGDQRKLNARSLGIIRDDVLEIISGVRDLRTSAPLGTYNSLDGTLEWLRQARDCLQIALGMFNDLGKLNENKSAKFFSEMRSARKHIEQALRFFTPN